MDSYNSPQQSSPLQTYLINSATSAGSARSIEPSQNDRFVSMLYLRNVPDVLTIALFYDIDSYDAPRVACAVSADDSQNYYSAFLTKDIQTNFKTQITAMQIPPEIIIGHDKPPEDFDQLQNELNFEQIFGYFKSPPTVTFKIPDTPDGAKRSPVKRRKLRSDRKRVKFADQEPESGDHSDNEGDDDNDDDNDNDDNDDENDALMAEIMNGEFSPPSKKRRTDTAAANVVGDNFEPPPSPPDPDAAPARPRQRRSQPRRRSKRLAKAQAKQPPFLKRKVQNFDFDAAQAPSAVKRQSQKNLVVDNEAKRPPFLQAKQRSKSGRSDLPPTQPNLESTQPDLDATQPNLESTQPNLDATQPNLESTQPNLDATQPNLDATQADLPPTQAEPSSEHKQTYGTDAWFMTSERSDSG